jgi:hypothetical protein
MAVAVFDAARLAVPLACLLGVVIAVASVLSEWEPQRQKSIALWGGCLLLYVIVTEIAELLAFGGASWVVPIAVAWLTPLIVGGVALPRRGLWLTAVGYWLVLFSGTAALQYNFSHYTSGFMGFFHGWVF